MSQPIQTATDPKKEMPVKTSGKPDLTAEIIETMEAFSSLEEAWNTLAVESDATIFQVFEWQFLWWKHFGVHRSRKLHIVVLRHSGRLVGVAPLFLESVGAAGLVFSTRLRLIGSPVPQRTAMGLSAISGVMDYLDVLCAPDFETTVNKALTDYLMESSRLFDELEMTELKPDSFVVSTLIPELVDRDARVTVSELQMISHTSVPTDFDTFKAACNRRLRRQLSKAQKNFKDDEIQDVTTSQAFQDGLETLVALHQSRWNRMGFPGLFENPVFAKLQHELLPHMLERGWLWLKLIRKDEAPVAARLGFQFNGHFYDYITGFDTDAPCSKHGPGTALMIDMLEDAIECGGKSLDLLRGDESFKMEWMSESSHNSRMVLSVSSPSSVRQRIARLVMAVRGLRYRLNHESTLIHVYYRQHGPLGFIRPYSKSRLSRFRDR